MSYFKNLLQEINGNITNCQLLNLKNYKQKSKLSILIVLKSWNQTKNKRMKTSVWDFVYVVRRTFQNLM